MNEYRITCNITKAQGWQSWIVNAESEREALDKYAAGVDVIFEDEEVEVTSLGEPDIEDMKWHRKK